MRTRIVALAADLPVPALAKIAAGDDQPRGQHLYPVLDDTGALIAVVTRRELRSRLHDPGFAQAQRPLEQLMRPDPVVAHPADTLREVAARMAETGLMSFPVVEPGDGGDGPPGQLVGMVGLPDLLRARERQLSEERHRQRWIRIRLFGGAPEPELQAAD
jgi:CBS domain-containing protein